MSEVISFTPPIATYRLQLTPEFGFSAARKILPYLKGLGISHLYLSPIWEATPGSSHGYDIVNPNEIRAELGGEEGFRDLSREAKAIGLKVIVDFVPNHMATHPQNPWWWDVLKKGPHSPYCSFFDLRPRPKLVLPILGKTLAEVLRAGELKIEKSGADYVLTYHDHHFPLREDSHKFLSKETSDEEGGETRHPSKKLLDRQYYRLTYWKESRRNETYRRFFNINELIGVNVEKAHVFEAVHQLLFRLFEEGLISGVRIDHVDGLRNPETYLTKLSENLNRLSSDKTQERAFLVVEKILHREERLPESWPIHGTTGYDFTDEVNQVMTNPEGFEDLTKMIRRLSRAKFDPEALILQSKRRVIHQLFHGELRRLVRNFDVLSFHHESSHPWTKKEVEKAIVALSIALKPYRTYISESGISTQDQRFLKDAFLKAKMLHPEISAPCWEAFEELFSIEPKGPSSSETYEERLDWIQRWQQFTGPVAAKGVEDTAFYNDHRLISRNEVGGELELPANALERFHEKSAERGERWPHALLATSTHDTKRSEDVRARIHMLSEISAEWESVFRRWQEMNRAKKVKVGRIYLPMHSLEHMIYQSLFGTYPVDERMTPDYLQRMKDFALKAMREGKAVTSWEETASAHEEAVLKFVEVILQDEKGFVPELKQFVERWAFCGLINSLSTLVLKMTVPGIPDFYQGTEDWNFSLVDPDNRRPVDYGYIQEKWNRVEDLATKEPDEIQNALGQDPTCKLAKILVTKKLLEARGDHPDLFACGSYIPLKAEGEGSDGFLCFARELERKTLVVAVPRFPSRHFCQRGNLLPKVKKEIKDAWVLLPSENSGDPVDLLRTTHRITCESGHGGGLRLCLSDWMSAFPVGVCLFDAGKSSRS